MKRTPPALLALFISTLAACQQGTPSEVPQTVNIEPKGACMSKVDSAVAGIVLGEEPGLVLGKHTKKGVPTKHLAFASRDGKQRLVMLSHKELGGMVIHQFEVMRRTGEEVQRSLANNEFITDQSIKLGMSKSSVMKKLGQCGVLSKSGGIERLTYASDSLPLVKEQEEKRYIAVYEFEKGNLSRFRFGFER